MRSFGLTLAAIAAVLWCAEAVLAKESSLLEARPQMNSVVPPLDSAEHLSTPDVEPPKLPVPDAVFYEHVRQEITPKQEKTLAAPAPAQDLSGISARITTPLAEQTDREWVGTEDGLYFRVANEQGSFQRHPTYGIDGPLSNIIAGIAVDSQNTLWVATPVGLSSRDPEDNWKLYRGSEGLPWEELTCIAVDPDDHLWLGSTRGLIQFRPYAKGRQWYYRAGERYLPHDQIVAVVTDENSRNAFVQTKAGWSRIEEVPRTLYDKAKYLQARYLDRHRRLGMPSPTYYDNAYAMKNWTHGHQASDALWTSYYVAAMSMAYALTGEERYRISAQEGMEALYFLQNITGIPGLVARSVVAVDEPEAERIRDQDSWHLTSDKKYYWRDDVSSDQMTGHYFAFYTYYQHIARHDAEQRARLLKQARQVTDYMVDNNYQIRDWDGKVTRWGWLNPEDVNDKPENFLENGIYSLMMLSFLRTAHHVTGDQKYLDHYVSLIEEHDYLSNLLLEKKLFPDELNHSDDQLSALLFYSYMQLEHDPFIRDAVHRSLRRHARIERDERNSLFTFVYASADPDDADVLGGIQTLRELPQDRRNWAMNNAYRADVRIDRLYSNDRHTVLLEALPADERDFQRWNLDPYRADTGGDGRTEGTGVQYLLPYWMGRYHGLIGEPEATINDQ